MIDDNQLNNLSNELDNAKKIPIDGTGKQANFIEIGTWIGGLFGQVVDGVSEVVTSVE